MDEKKGIELLFKRPLEPVFTTRDNGKAVLEVPSDFYTDHYKDFAVNIQNRFGDNVNEKVSVNDISKPDLSFVGSLLESNENKMRTLFSLFNNSHKRIAARLFNLLIKAPNRSAFLSLASYIKDRVNPELFQYALSVAVNHRNDTNDIEVPPIVETFPSSFVEPSVFSEARANLEVLQAGDRVLVRIPRNYTASEREDEQRLAYFREDIGVNMHHWHWHLVYPTNGDGDLSIVNKDRRGELFYYMHHQIVARYVTERYCNGLGHQKPLMNLREPIVEGYFPKLLSSLNSRTYPSRIENSLVRDINRPDNAVLVADLERWLDRIHQAIDQGYVVNSANQQIMLNEEKGIDILGNVLEASELSPNRQLYGDLHNMGHNTISFMHDPDNRFLESFGVMGDVKTAMRDPIFYRWHGHIDMIFDKYKGTIPQYSPSRLNFEGVNINSVEAKISTGRNVTPNVLLTYWQTSDIDIGAAIDFGKDDNVLAQYTHLQNAPFNITFQANNSGGTIRSGTCRIFICPQTNERGLPLTFNEKRLLMIELDKFTVQLKPGQNTVVRRSSESNVIIPYERTFRNVGEKFQGPNRNQFWFCGCGWPAHMLLPKGTIEGKDFHLFVMISNYMDDMVQQPNSNSPDPCADSSSFCGLKDKNYPDKRSMGYPFDRPYSNADSLEAFVQMFPNMMMQTIKIKFNDVILNRQN